MIALDSLKPAFSHLESSFGGATAMRLFFDHRESKDIDIFVTDSYMISGLSPRLNSATERLTGDYDEQSHYLKLKFPEGEVDFMISGKVVRDIPFADRVVRGRLVTVETRLEIDTVLQVLDRAQSRAFIASSHERRIVTARRALCCKRGNI